MVKVIVILFVFIKIRSTIFQLGVINIICFELDLTRISGSELDLTHISGKSAQTSHSLYKQDLDAKKAATERLQKGNTEHL